MVKPKEKKPKKTYLYNIRRSVCNGNNYKLKIVNKIKEFDDDKEYDLVMKMLTKETDRRREEEVLKNVAKEYLITQADHPNLVEVLDTQQQKEYKGGPRGHLI